MNLMLPCPWHQGCQEFELCANIQADLWNLALPAGILRGCLQLDAPAQHNRLLCFLPDGEMRPPPPSAARWATICTSLLLTQSQVRPIGKLIP